MSDEGACPACGQPLAVGQASCSSCGFSAGDEEAAADEFRDPALRGSVLHPLAPVVFVLAGLAVGILATMVYGPALGVPVGLVGGGLGVWVLERGRRLR
jgi:hypothetical protein